jgi:hypothetical protein
MGILQPYKRTCRQFIDGNYSAGGRSVYILHPKFANSPEHYVRGFLLLQKDLQMLFDYVEPADENLKCYSYRIHELLLRACVEVEANCKAILLENGYSRKSSDLDMQDYKKINASHLLSSYNVKVPYWHGTKNLRSPFLNWKNDGSLTWYQAYNLTKHDRQDNFILANLENVVDAICGVVVLLSAQFYNQDFSPGDCLLASEGPRDGMESAIGGYFRVKFPDDWPLEQRYDFNWQALNTEQNPFQNYPYS